MVNNWVVKQMVLLLNESYLFKNDTLGVRSTSEGIGLPAGSQMGLFVVQIGPSLNTTILDVFSGGSDDMLPGGPGDVLPGGTGDVLPGGPGDVMSGSPGDV